MKHTRDTVRRFLISWDRRFEQLDLSLEHDKQTAKVAIWLLLNTRAVASPIRPSPPREVQELWVGRRETYERLNAGVFDYCTLQTDILGLARHLVPRFLAAAQAHAFQGGRHRRCHLPWQSLQRSGRR